jgi:GNAT superfamily N-acetyltransferase
MWGRVFRDGSRVRFAVALVERRVVGCMMLHEHFSTWRDAPVLSLEDFFVAPTERGKGIGTAMLAFAERHAEQQGAALLELHVRRENERAQQLYKRSGFEEAPYAWMHKKIEPRPGAPPRQPPREERRRSSHRRRRPRRR